MGLDKLEDSIVSSSSEMETKEKSLTESSDESSGPKSDKSDEVPEWQDLLGSGSIMKKILREGTPDTRPEKLQKCTISYELGLDDGTFVEKKENFVVDLGDSEVVQGLDVALGLMNINEKCMLKIQARLAFGSVGLAPKIPPNATVIYVIELVDVTDASEPGELSISERKLKGNNKKTRGNWWYERGDYTSAIHCYRRALDYLDEVEGGISDPNAQPELSDSALQDLLEDRLSVNNNMAAAQIRLELYDPALISLQAVLRCQPNNVKALFRKAKIHRAKNDLQSALKCLKKAENAEPSNEAVRKEIESITKLMQKQKLTERELAKRMFADQNQSNKGNAMKEPKKKFLVWSATVAASFAMGLLAIAAYRLRYV